MNLQTQLNRLGEVGNALEIFVGSPWHLSATLLSEKPDYVLILCGVWRNGSSGDELIKEVLSHAFFVLIPMYIFVWAHYIYPFYPLKPHKQQQQSL